MANYKKTAVPLVARRELAKKYGLDGKGQVGAACYWCGADGYIHWVNGYWVTFDSLEIDHFIPEIHGGSHHADNLVLACRRCNRQRKDRSAEEFLEWRAANA